MGDSAAGGGGAPHRRLRARSDTLARLGGDEFTVILAGLDHVGSVERIAQAMVALLARPFDAGRRDAVDLGQRRHRAVSADAVSPELLAHADQAMYASRTRPQPLQLFHAGLAGGGAGAPACRCRPARGAAGQQFEILPAHRVAATGAVRKAEALLRWRHPQRGLLAPAEFIPFAESAA
jgi:predicted signal transduction protein with EAL and GGDEF domain